jgi:hypothetical protein
MNKIIDLMRKYRMATSLLVGLLVGFLVLVLFSDADASKWNHDHNIDLTITQQYEPHDHDSDPLSISSDPSSGVGNSELDLSRAMSSAGDTCVFDYAPGWQGCGGYGWSGGEQAFNFSGVTRIDEFMFRMNLQTDKDFDEYAGSVGASWHF